MSDIPETPTGAARVLIGWFAGGLAFEVVHQLSDGHRLAAFVFAVGAIAVAIFDYNLARILAGSPRLTSSLNRIASDARWWVAMAMVSLLVIAASRFIEEGRWPYSAKPVALTDIAPSPPKPDIQRDFNSEYNLHADRLGKLIKPIEMGETLYYQAWHDKALVTWQGGTKQFFCVISYDSAHRSFCEDETDMSRSHHYVGNSAEFRAMFKGLPNDKLPPYAGIARRWLLDPTKWSWIGYVDRECEYRGPSYFWELSAGRIIGVFRYKFDAPAGQIISIANDGTNTAKPTINAPECREPRERQSSK